LKDNPGFQREGLAEQTLEGRKENLNQANNLSRTYATLLEALNRHRGKGQQKVTVEHVHVHEGGQVIVGNGEGVARHYIEQHKDGWKNPKHRQQWENTLTTYVYTTPGIAR
jgi:hypothetical protein